MSLVTTPPVLAAQPAWALVLTLLALAVVVTAAGLILLVRNRGGRP